MNNITMIRRVIKDLETWIKGKDEEEIRNAICKIFPSWKICKETYYGPVNKRGYQECRIQMFKDGDYEDVVFYR